jgi:methyl-accepting chemotaxis protein
MKGLGGMAFNPWTRFSSQRALWLSLAVALGTLLLTTEIIAALVWARGRLAPGQLGSLRTELIVAALITETVAVLVVWWATSSITRPLVTAVRVLDRIAQGDLTAHLHIANRDEVGRLAAAINMTSTELSEALGQVGIDASRLALSARQIDEVSDRLGIRAGSTSAQAEAVTEAAASVRDSTQIAAESIDSMTTAIREITGHVDDATHVAGQAVQAAQATSTTVARLGDSSAEIGNVVKVINAIAEQTNLLALNATIEAARAGDAGKGFAVVAGEVKDLAQETARATDDIAQRVAAIQADTSNATAEISGIGTIIGRIDQYQQTVAAALREQAATAERICTSVAEVAGRAAEISTRISALSSSTLETSEEVQTVRRSAGELNDMAGRLAQLVSHYRCSTDRQSAADLP